MGRDLDAWPLPGSTIDVVADDGTGGCGRRPRPRESHAVFPLVAGSQDDNQHQQPEEPSEVRSDPVFDWHIFWTTSAAAPELLRFKSSYETSIAQTCRMHGSAIIARTINLDGTSVESSNKGVRVLRTALVCISPLDAIRRFS